MIDDIIFGKKARIDECVRRIRTYMDGFSDQNSIDDRIRIDAAAFNILRIIQQCIDLANHVVRVRRLGIPRESRESFFLLAKEGLISKELSQTLMAMLDFRRTVLHSSEGPDAETINDVVEHRLDDVVAFTVRVMEIE